MVRVVSVDFEGVEGGGGSSHVPEGDYGLKISKVIKKKAESSGMDCLYFDLKIFKGNAKGIGKPIRHTCSLQKQSLWNLRNLLEAAGKEVPARALKIDLDKLTNLELGATLVDDQFERDGKIRVKSVIAGFFPISELTATSTGKDTSELEEGVEDEEETAGEEVEDTGSDDELFE